ncbi:Sip1-related alpha-galactosidase [Flavivirga spongiicola]|uniref:Raffinose synthase n=1 Tax=Flavivirga spongiicola TaxID=421621 RepID=A0ABU7XNK4_9FLAO|nr:Sip1-related alpha-galactosidase [Flavivirga sp. MEBiC05379]MDO5977348.1 Sip1-related alpha-galactosidase [Flavivirga sp. MEBiC05379]
MKLLKIASYIWIFICLAYSCNNSKSVKKSHDLISISGNNQGINIQWNNKSRVTGGIPIFQNKAFQINNTDIKNDNEHTIIQYTNTSDSTTIEVQSLINTDNNTLILSLSSNGHQSKNGEDYVGLFFNDFPEYQEGMASYLFGDWESWTKPVQVSDYKNTLSEKILFFLFKYNDGTYGAMMPLGGEGYNATLGSQQHKFGAHSVSYKNNFEAVKVPLMAIAFGGNPYETVKNLYESGMTAMGKEKGLRKNKTYPEIFESIGWCSWNALGEDVTEKKLMDAVATFSENKFPLPFMLIDDGWLSINDEKQLTSFNFDTTKFPNGFKASAEKLKTTHGVKNIGVWHTMNGYWSGVSKNNFKLNSDKPLMPYYDKNDVHADSLSGITYHTPNAVSNSGQNFYNAWYEYLKNQGINFVKVDQQSVIKRVAKGQLSKTDNIPFWDIATNLESNLQSAIKNHFNGAVINCQDMATEAVYNFTSSAIGRNSDDFFPERTAYFSLEVEKGNAAAHVLMNVHNSMWYSNMVWPDFDMFQSHHIDGEYHAISRAISGGPVYLTDTPGKQNFDILNQLILNNGKILRPDVPALPTEDCLFQLNEEKLFKTFSTVNNSGLIGAWNTVDADLVEGTISPTDVNGLQGDTFAVYDYFSKSVKKLGASETVSVVLKRKGYKLYSIVPLENDIAIIGLLNKYISPKAIQNQKIDKNTIDVTLIHGGEFGAYLPSEPKEVIINGTSLVPEDWSYTSNLFILKIVDETMSPVRIEIKL